MTPRPTVLIADDDPVSRKILDALFSNEGYELTFATDGLDALAQASAVLPDVILLDVMMPGLNGFEVCRRLRADERLAEVPVLMVTSLQQPDSRIAGIEAGADEFISKPFDPIELRTRVRADRKSTRLNSSHIQKSRMPSSA